MSHFDYLTDPHEIERRSFAQIRQLTDLSRFDADQQQIAMRLVHTSGDPNIAEAIHFSPGAVAAGLAALTANAAILCDVDMVRQGINRHYLSSEVYCFLSSAKTVERAEQLGETRSMAAMAQWTDHLAGSIVAIGNAPTALFRLLDMLYAGSPKPALIIGMPVGFINAKESKAALLEHGPQHFSIPCITVQGNRGGSTLAVATVNALARLHNGIRL
jgi:precorrin-8X/cobalt-precorrin-8 methylmutase